MRKPASTALAIAVGTAHGMYKGEPNIRFDIIEEVARSIPVPIVLHGGSGVPDDMIRKAIQAALARSMSTRKTRSPARTHSRSAGQRCQSIRSAQIFGPCPQCDGGSRQIENPSVRQQQQGLTLHEGSRGRLRRPVLPFFMPPPRTQWNPRRDTELHGKIV